MSPEKEETLATLAGVTLESLSSELAAAWWAAYKGLANNAAWSRSNNSEDPQIALELVRLAVKVRYHVS